MNFDGWFWIWFGGIWPAAFGYVLLATLAGIDDFDDLLSAVVVALLWPFFLIFTILALLIAVPAVAGRWVAGLIAPRAAAIRRVNKPYWK